MEWRIGFVPTAREIYFNFFFYRYLAPNGARNSSLSRCLPNIIPDH